MSVATPQDAVICCIARNEERYIDEWIRYHLLRGFAHIYIYDNSHDHSLRNKKSEKVTVIHLPGDLQQLVAYDAFVLGYRQKHTWCAFIDCDEFIVLKRHRTIMEFLREYQDCKAIILYWKMFGTNHEAAYRDEPVTKRFTRCADHINPHFKSICQLRYIHKYINPHKPLLTTGTICDTNRRIVPLDDYRMEGGDDKVACIHHYYSKSEQEFVEKIERGRADVSTKISRTELDDLHSRNNDVWNTEAWDFYSAQ
jgi:hypothetical protein